MVYAHRADGGSVPAGFNEEEQPAPNKGDDKKNKKPEESPTPPTPQKS